MNKKHLCISVTEETDQRLRKYAAANHCTVSQTITNLIWHGAGFRENGMPSVQRVLMLSPDTDERLRQWCWENHKTADEAVNDWIWHGLKVKNAQIRGQESLF